MFNPKSATLRTVIKNNRISYNFYPYASEDTPSIKGRRCFIPLPFWFTKNPSAALPLVALQFQIVEISIRLRPIHELYQLYDNETGNYISPFEWRALPRYQGDNVDIGRFLSFEALETNTSPNNVIDLDAYLECNFIFLDDAERRQVAGNSVDILVERLYRSETSGIKNQGTVDLVVSNPIKEMIFITRRSDVSKYNGWANFTMDVTENENMPILKTAKLLWNGVDRFEEKPYEFFNLLQPYQHHSNIGRQGIYSYSFALYPEKWQPTGSFNASMINKIQLYVTINDDSQLDIPTDYTVVVYSVYYNIFRIIGGNGGMVFTS